MRALIRARRSPPSASCDARRLDVRLLIVTTREDLAADFLIVRLEERQLSYYRLNTDELADTEVKFRAGGGQAPACSIACGGATFDLDEIGSVYYRRAVRPEASRVDVEFRAFANAELRHLYEGLIMRPEILWVNPLEATDRAERKIYQLRLAEANGLLIPPTLVSNDRPALVRFAAEQGRVICKTISQGMVICGGEAFAIYTREVTPEDVAQIPESMSVPTFLQRLIPKGRDVRVTIIGESIFPVEILLPGGSSIDWRASREGLIYRSCEIPQAVERACRALMSALGISYGAFDFVCSDESEWYFLEVNPAGEWAWLEVELDLPMRDAFIELLYGRLSS